MWNSLLDPTHIRTIKPYREDGSWKRMKKHSEGITPLSSCTDSTTIFGFFFLFFFFLEVNYGIVKNAGCGYSKWFRELGERKTSNLASCQKSWIPR